MIPIALFVRKSLTPGPAGDLQKYNGKTQKLMKNINILKRKCCVFRSDIETV